jgi:hypothetical protein
MIRHDNIGAPHLVEFPDENTTDEPRTPGDDNHARTLPLSFNFCSRESYERLKKLDESV